MFRFTYKFIQFILALALVFILITQWNMLKYGFMQARGQLKVMWNTRSVDETLKDPFFPDSLKTKLRLIEEIKIYAFDSLGIDHSGNYSSVYDQHGKPLVWVVTASPPFSID